MANNCLMVEASQAHHEGEGKVYVCTYVRIQQAFDGSVLTELVNSLLSFCLLESSFVTLCFVFGGHR